MSEFSIVSAAGKGGRLLKEVRLELGVISIQEFYMSEKKEKGGIEGGKTGDWPCQDRSVTEIGRGKRTWQRKRERDQKESQTGNQRS